MARLKEKVCKEKRQAGWRDRLVKGLRDGEINGDLEAKMRT